MPLYRLTPVPSEEQINLFVVDAERFFFYDNLKISKKGVFRAGSSRLPNLRRLAFRRYGLNIEKVN